MKREFCLDIVQDMLECAKGDPDSLKIMIAYDVYWVCNYDPEYKAQSLQFKSPSDPRLKKTSQVKSKVKMMQTFFITTGLCIMNMHQLTGAICQTVNKHLYREVLHCLHYEVWHEKLDLWELKTASCIMTMPLPILCVRSKLV